MGMFDDIEFEMDCPGCGKKLKNFQSKDGECLLQKLKPTDVNNFYDFCQNCKGFVEFNRVKPVNIDDFEMTFVPGKP